MTRSHLCNPTQTSFLAAAEPEADGGFASFGGRGAAATAEPEAEAVAAAEELGHEVGVWESRKVNLDFLTEADMVFVGTWTDGIIIGGHRPGDAGRLLDLPGIWGKPTAGFLTYAIHAGKVVDGLADVVKLRGGDWLGGNVFKRNKLPDGIAGFVVAAIDAAAERLGTPADA